MRFSVLGSGSSGNATLVQGESSQLLVDAGLSARQLQERMKALEVLPGELAGIILTHEHTDHIRGLQVFCKNHGIPVYTTAITHEAIQHKLKHPVSWQLFDAGQRLSIGEFELESVPIPHDAVDPVAYVVSSGAEKLAHLTDLGHVTTLVRERVRGCQAMVLEANYDFGLLEADQKRPWSIKQRISSRHGHLSNEQAVEFAQELVPDGLSHLVLGHLSRDCNCPVRVQELFGRLSLEQLLVAGQETPTPWVELARHRMVA